jgi:hypothetical protein
MIRDIQLAAVVAEGAERRLLRIPMTQQLQGQLSAQWSAQFDAFNADVEEVDFDPGFIADEHHRFKVSNFEIPAWLTPFHSQNIGTLDPLDPHEHQLDRVRGIAGFAKTDGRELVLFQNFTRSHIIEPGRFMFIEKGTFQSTAQRGITLADRLTAVLHVADRRLVFANFRSANVILPLADLYREASEEEVREVLGHDKLAPEDLNATASNPSQWARKHFAMLRSSTVLDDYTSAELLNRGKKVGVTIRVKAGKIVFPADKAEAKKLLQFLTEELFRGAVTDTLYATNSKRAAE